VVGERDVGPRPRRHLAHRPHVGVQVGIELGLRQLRIGLGVESLVAVGDVDRQDVADVGHVDLHPGQRRRVAVLAEQVHLVAQTDERRGELGVVDVGAGPTQQVAVEDQYAHGDPAYVAAGRRRNVASAA
jgi:hypothetical protein